jgi:CDGSH-type Zn-finger protein
MKITFVENGPFILKTDAQVSLRLGADRESRRGPITLCRCGQSHKKPFCDGTHREAGFKAPAGELDLDD